MPAYVAYAPDRRSIRIPGLVNTFLWLAIIALVLFIAYLGCSMYREHSGALSRALGLGDRDDERAGAKEPAPEAAPQIAPASLAEPAPRAEPEAQVQAPVAITNSADFVHRSTPLSAFQGGWFEVARIEHRLTRGRRDIAANFTFREGEAGAPDSCGATLTCHRRNKNEPAKRSDVASQSVKLTCGQAGAVPSLEVGLRLMGLNLRFRVHVVASDPDRFVVVGSAKHGILVLLARDPFYGASPRELDKLLPRIRTAGFSVKQFNELRSSFAEHYVDTASMRARDSLLPVSELAPFVSRPVLSAYAKALVQQQ